MVTFALNQVSAPTVGWRAFVSAAKRMGCAGVEMRNDLGRPLFDGAAPEEVATLLAQEGIALVGLAEIAAFNDLDADAFDQALDLIRIAKAAKASAVALIPAVGRGAVSVASTAQALRQLAPALEEAGLMGLVEPIGFTTSSLRTKSEALDAMARSGAPERFALIHDTFHHHIAGEAEFFAAQTAMVHVSGVTQSVPVDRLTDADRVLVDGDDVMGNVDQLKRLIANGYSGPVSLEAFSPAVQALEGSVEAFGATFGFLRQQLEVTNFVVEA